MSREGIVLLGLPVGDDAFVAKHLREKGEKIEKMLLIVEEIDHAQLAVPLHCACLSVTIFNYVFRTKSASHKPFSSAGNVTWLFTRAQRPTVDATCNSVPSDLTCKGCSARELSRSCSNFHGSAATAGRFPWASASFSMPTILASHYRL